MALGVTEDDFHGHLLERMSQRGVSKEEVEYTLIDGWEAADAKSETQGKTFVFPYQKEWEGRWYKEKEVTVYYKMLEGVVVLLTVKARYGLTFPKGKK